MCSKFFYSSPASLLLVSLSRQFLDEYYGSNGMWFNQGYDISVRMEADIDIDIEKFNTECDRILGSKSNVQNYRKSMINTMEVFLNEIIKFQKHNVEAMKTKKRKNGNF